MRLFCVTHFRKRRIAFGKSDLSVHWAIPERITMSKHDCRSQTWPTCLLLMFSFSGIVSAQTINIVAVTNSADFATGLPQKGSLASIFCTGLQGEPGIVSATQYPLSNRVNDISVWINSVPAPILAIAFQDGYQQINVQVPW